MNIIYLRVSKEEEGLQDLLDQKTAILNKFNLKDYSIFSERCSAYDLSKMHKRKEFLKILDLLFNYGKTTIKDIVLNNIEKKNINFYVWDYARIMRNLELNLLFSMLSYWFNINVYSYKDGNIEININENPSKKLLRYMQYAIQGFSAEDYSYNTSKNILKSVKRKGGITLGTSKNPNGIKWGRRFNDLNNRGVILSPNKIIELNKRINALITYYKKEKKDFYYSLIIEKIRKEFKLNISKGYISKIKSLRGLKNG